jgi:Tol biopolymer transport system component
MRLATVVLTASMAGALSIAAQSPLAPPSSTQAREFPDPVPRDQKVDHFVLSVDGQRTYFVNSTGDVWLSDRALRTSARVAGGPMWDLNLSPTGDALAYTKGGARRGDQYVWVLGLNPATGLAVGAERQLSGHQGDVPSVSPDGKLVAFARDDSTGVGQSVVVVPIAGGSERVVAPALPSSVANIRWTPDGKTLYFGVNPPVACVPEWSCLPLAEPLRQPAGTIRRVEVAGGALTTVATGRGVSPGLSPDGTTLMYLDTGSTRRWVVANADGTRRDTMVLPPTQTPSSWLRGSTVLIASGGSIRRLRTMSLADGRAQTVVDGADTLSDPSWSPDGKLMMIVARGAPRAELRILNADGSPQRTVPLPENFAYGTAWSPDQRWIAYIGSGEKPPARIAAIELASGRSRPLYDLTNNQFVSFRWFGDSRAIVLAETFDRPENTRRVAFRTVDLDGKTAPLREFPLGPPPSVGLLIDDATAIVMQNRQTGYRLMRLNGDGAERDVLAGRAGDSPGAVSQDGQWLTVRRAPVGAEGAQTSVLELTRVDGSAHRTIPVPFLTAGGNNPLVVPGGNDLIVVEARRPDGDSGVYLLSANTQAVRKLFTYSPQFGPPQLTISPDGRSLVYLITESVPPSLLTMDLAVARGGDR